MRHPLRSFLPPTLFTLTQWPVALTHPISSTLSHPYPFHLYLHDGSLSLDFNRGILRICLARRVAPLSLELVAARAALTTDKSGSREAPRHSLLPSSPFSNPPNPSLVIAMISWQCTSTSPSRIVTRTFCVPI